MLKIKNAEQVRNLQQGEIKSVVTALTTTMLISAIRSWRYAND
jgi:hypothetical protein